MLGHITPASEMAKCKGVVFALAYRTFHLFWMNVLLSSAFGRTWSETDSQTFPVETKINSAPEDVRNDVSWLF